MTFPAALLGATVRALRTAAGRRALQLVLLVGGLFALGFLCGEQAHAADGTPVPAQATSVRSVEAAGHGDVVRAVSAVTERVDAQAHTAGERAVTPVREALTTVSRTVETVGTVGTTAVRTVVDEPRASAPSLPLPDLPHGTDVPVVPTPEPKSTAPRPQGSGGAAASVATERQKQRYARAQDRTAVGAPARSAVYGPEAAPVPRPLARTVARRGGATLGVPGRPVPAGDSDGVLGKQAADASASRHADAHAVTLDHRAPLRLVPGAAARVDAPRTRDRYRDIPVFPG